ncbi:hypothetical protein JCM3765_003855 [Sporobolomyces pararoseus]
MDPSTFESSHVHKVYNEIANDFSRTRHSRWPFVENFLNNLPSGSLVLDAGTGNGKYLGVKSLLNWNGKPEDFERLNKGKEKEQQVGGSNNNELFNVGYDMSEGLLGIASEKGHEVVRGDCVDMSCWRRGSFDHAISIATIHHFATPERRTESIKQMILSILPPSPPNTTTTTSTTSFNSSATTTTKRSTRRPGQILIVVWSLEQDPSLLGARSARRTTGGKKGAVEIPDLDFHHHHQTLSSLDLELQQQQRKDQGRDLVVNQLEEEEEGDNSSGGRKGKDVFVPWEKQEPVVPRKKKEPTPRRRPNGKKENSTTHTPEVEEEGGGERGMAKLSLKEEEIKSEPSPTGGEATPLSTTSSTTDSSVLNPKPTFNRYYHLFAHYELSLLVKTAAESLNLTFEYPSGYPLGANENQVKDDAESSSKVVTARGGGGERKDGWEGYVKLKEERWERENWVAEIEVGWRFTAN